MSAIEEVERDIKVAAVELGMREMARRSGLPEATTRKLIKKGHSVIENLKKLEAVATEHRISKSAA